MKPGTYVRPSIQIKLVAFFAANPTEELTASDATQKFDLSSPKVTYEAMAALTRHGYLVASFQSHPRIWKAGPTLLKLIGKD